MHKKYNKFLIVSFIGVLIFGYYSYVDNKIRSEAAISSDDEPLTSSLDTANAKSPSVVSDTGNTQATEDTAFLNKLASLKTIKIDSSIFESKTFSSLVDNNIKLEPVPYGRTNPFAPIEGAVVVNNKPTFMLNTIKSSQVTSKTAILSGSIEGATSENIYFEYGTTPAMGKVTPKVTPSMVGNFSVLINSLDSKATYFFRVAANINGTVSYGETLSFNTN